MKSVRIEGSKWKSASSGNLSTGLFGSSSSELTLSIHNIRLTFDSLKCYLDRLLKGKRQSAVEESQKTASSWESVQWRIEPGEQREK